MEVLVYVELRFRADGDPEQLADRVAEAVRMIAGRDNLEDFRWRALPLEPPKDRIPRPQPEESPEL